MSYIAIIGARGGSKGIKNKNIKELAGYPLIAYSIAYAKTAKQISRTIVTTDSPLIEEIALKYGAEVPELRPPYYATDNCTDMQLFQYLYGRLGTWNVDVEASIVHLRPTSPFRSYKHLTEAIKLMEDSPEAHSLRSVHESNLCPWKMFWCETDGYLRGIDSEKYKEVNEYYNWPRQNFPRAYEANGVVDLIKKHDKNMLHGKNILKYETERLPDIDTEVDWINAETLLRQENSNRLLEQNVLEYLRLFKEDV